MKRKKEKIECCDICKVDIRENKQKENKLYIPLIICFFIAAVLLLLQKVNKNNKCCVCVYRKEDMNSETSNWIVPKNIWEVGVA